jgi:hypothetical protein
MASSESESWRELAWRPGVEGFESDFALTVAKAESLASLGEGLERLERAWGSASLAAAFAGAGPAMPKTQDGPPTALGFVASVWFLRPPPGGALDRLGLLLDAGAIPDAGVAGTRSGLDCAFASSEWADSPLSPAGEAVAMMLSKSARASEAEWVEEMCSKWPGSAARIAREWANRQKRAVAEAAGCAGRGASSRL